MGEDVDVGAEGPDLYFVSVWGCGSASDGFVLFARLRGIGILLIWLASGGEWFPGCGRGGFQDLIGCGGEVVLALRTVNGGVL